MPLYQVRIVDRNNKTYASIFEATSEVDALDQLHACHRSWKVFRPAIARLELWTYRPGVFDPGIARWTSAACRRVETINIPQPGEPSRGRRAR